MFQPITVPRRCGENIFFYFYDELNYVVLLRVAEFRVSNARSCTVPATSRCIIGHDYFDMPSLESTASDCMARQCYALMTRDTYERPEQYTHDALLTVAHQTWATLRDRALAPVLHMAADQRTALQLRRLHFRTVHAAAAEQGRVHRTRRRRFCYAFAEYGESLSRLDIRHFCCPFCFTFRCPFSLYMFSFKTTSTATQCIPTALSTCTFSSCPICTLSPRQGSRLRDVRHPQRLRRREQRAAHTLLPRTLPTLARDQAVRDIHQALQRHDANPEIDDSHYNFFDKCEFYMIDVSRTTTT